MNDRAIDDDFEFDDFDEIEDDATHCPDCGGDLDGDIGCMDPECGWTYEDDEG